MMSSSENTFFDDIDVESEGQALSHDLWANAINTLLTALENIFLDENGMPFKQRETVTALRSRGLTSLNQMIEETPLAYFSPLKRKREGDILGKSKSQKLANSLSSQMARSLSLNDSQQGEGQQTDSSMDLENSFISPLPFASNPSFTSQRVFKRCLRPNNNKVAKPFGTTFMVDVVMTESSIEIENREFKEQTHPARIQMLQKILAPCIDGGNWSASSMTKWFEMQAQKRNISMPEFERRFQERTQEMESILSAMQHIITHDYEQILASIDRFLINADWLRNDYSKPFLQLFPAWHNLGRNMENIVRFIDVMEDMKTTIKSVFPQTDDLRSELELIGDLLLFKKSLYGEILQQSGLAWRVLGFPVQDSWICETKRWLVDLAIRSSLKLYNELAKYNESTDVDDPRLVQLMDNIICFLKIARQTVDLVGTPNGKLSSLSLNLGTIYIHWTLSQIEKLEHKVVRSLEVKLMHICENFNLILQHLRSIQDADGEMWIWSLQNQVQNKEMEEFAAALVEAGLRLCEHMAKPKSLVTNGPDNITYIYSEFVMKFVNKVIKYAGREHETEARMRALLISLRNMEAAMPFI